MPFPLPITILLLVLAACRGDAASDPRILVLGTDTIVLPDSIGLITIEVGRREDGISRFEPPTAQASTGDIVRFTSLDNGSHAIAFDAVAPDARTYLEQSSQRRSPPLLTADAAWIVNLRGAPPGPYPFSCATHGERGTLTVVARR